ncbi:hypothetical protein HanXRQr2_Chr01g0033341 [Helianthus annuus]|uniref:Uncharacterized protein n=1 Tax=Helianthus annuus TaxID=4232 RepID=A0A251VQ96_HELAN|nr:hypothetical protein HanXRQr2_Chr01g0033341 [Helianthus annuus]KAJ0957849.1 hypothetical protein HanPSC8_Chr01g0032501 [Helianthus annuus]
MFLSSPSASLNLLLETSSISISYSSASFLSHSQTSDKLFHIITQSRSSHVIHLHFISISYRSK